MAIAEFVAKGQAKYSAKVAGMKASYSAAAGRAAQNFGAAGFGPTRTGNYQKALTSYAQQNYQPNGSWVQKWATNYAAKMAE